MRLKSIAYKSNRGLDSLRFYRLRNSLGRSEFIMSSEVRSSITESLEVGELRELAGIPENALVRVAGEIRPADAPKGFFALFEYPFKVGFRWPYSPLARAFMTRFDVSPGQLMPQFWRVVHVIERVTRNWDRPPFSVDDLLSAYNVIRSPYNRFGLFPRGRSDAMLGLCLSIIDTKTIATTITFMVSDDLVAYSDADWGGCPDSRRSTSGYCVFLGDNLLSWSAKRQPTVSRSSAEAEYRGVANAVAETTWIRNLLFELHNPLSRASVVFCDNVSAVYLSNNPVQHQRTKHIEIDIHFVREKVRLGHIKVLHVPSSMQYADIFTKGLSRELFQSFRSSLRVCPPPAQTAGIRKQLQPQLLLHGTQVNDRGWKARYVFVQTSSVIGEESWVVPEWNKGAIDFSFEETTEAIERFLSYSVTDQKYRTSKGGDESDVEPEVQIIEETDMEGSASKKASTMEAAARAAKRKAAAQEGLVAKRTRSSYVSVDTPPKDAARKAEGGIEAIPLSFAPPAKGAGASKADKGKEKEGSGLTTMTIQIPSDFMVDDVIRTAATFPVLEQFHVPAQKARMEEADIEDLDASIAGISFLALQTSLSLHTRMAKIKEELASNQNDVKLAKKEADKAKKKLTQLTDEINAKSVQAGTQRRVSGPTARTAEIGLGPCEGAGEGVAGRSTGKG
ncbi:hypothetical protein OSB04_000109 [Centaurea solstitialis]|uniref:Uncharacterized protein n=1 Tax=Centaurea solstitialis TaxID=347529 RepID=A0AA38U7X4_9ASTR|nr:hypothetical protein OSB04_000109 [Centaurea solstitialis]